MSIKISNIFSSETTGPIGVRFFIEHLSLMGKKVYIMSPGHMTKMAPCPYMVKTFKIFFSRTISQMTLKLGGKVQTLEPYKSCKIMNWVYRDLFYDKVKFVPVGV